jgi:hypothetical protein
VRQDGAVCEVFVKSVNICTIVIIISTKAGNLSPPSQLTAKLFKAAGHAEHLITACDTAAVIISVAQLVILRRQGCKEG